MEGNYNACPVNVEFYIIIPLREMEGNYNPTVQAIASMSDYTLERDGRELQPRRCYKGHTTYYTLERWKGITTIMSLV